MSTNKETAMDATARKNPVTTRFTQTLLSRMSELDLSQADLARHSDISKDMICRYLGGKALPKDDNLVKLAKALKIKDVDLLPTRGHGDKYAAAIASPIQMIVNDADPTISTLVCSLDIATEHAGEVMAFLVKYIQK